MLIPSTGIAVPVGPEQTMTTCRAMVLCVTADLPGKAKVLAFNRYNGQYGCSVCTQEGEVVAVGRGNARVYQYMNLPAPLRTHWESHAHGKQAPRTQMVNYAININPNIVFHYVMCLLFMCSPVLVSRRCQHYISCPHLT